MKQFPQKTGMYLGIRNEIYHQDRTHISKSWLDRIAITPLHLFRYLNEPYEKTLALILGSAVDCLVFEPNEFDKQFVQGPTDSKRTKVGKEVWEEANRHANDTKRDIIEIHNQVNYWDQVHQMAEAIMGNGMMREFLQDGVGQAVFVCQDSMTGLKKKCKTDTYHKPSNTIVDLKTAVSASPEEFGRSIANYRYHVQDAYYSDIVEEVVGKSPRFLFGVMEKPIKDQDADGNMMAFYELPESERIAGRNTYQSDLGAIAFAQDNDEWAGYAQQVLTIERPVWAVNRDQ